MTIPFLDLTPQYDSISRERDEAVQAVIRSQRFILGQLVERLEIEYRGVVIQWDA